MNNTAEKLVTRLLEAPKESRFRCSIYADVFVPATGDVESEREAAKKIVEEYAESIPNSYVGGVAFYNPRGLNPLDAEI